VDKNRYSMQLAIKEQAQITKIGKKGKKVFVIQPVSCVLLQSVLLSGHAKARTLPVCWVRVVIALNPLIWLRSSVFC